MRRKFLSAIPAKSHMKGQDSALRVAVNSRPALSLKW